MKTLAARNKKGFTPLEINHLNKDLRPDDTSGLSLTGPVRNSSYYTRNIISNRAGFTLIELILVAIIILVMTVLALPRFRKTFQELQAKEFIQNLISLGFYARERAVIERKVFRINLDSSKHLFWLSVRQLNESEFKKLNDRISRPRAIPQTVSFETNINHIDFYPDGRTDKVSAVIKNSDSLTYILISDENLGLLKLLESE